MWLPTSSILVSWRASEWPHRNLVGECLCTEGGGRTWRPVEGNEHRMMCQSVPNPGNARWLVGCLNIFHLDGFDFLRPPEVVEAGEDSNLFGRAPSASC